jgi:hypothetical protein
LKDALLDSTVKISSKKAEELGLSKGDIVALVGRRRRASYAVVSIQSGTKGGKATSSCELTHNMASNLRLRNGDKVKIVPLEAAMENKEERSGDMLLLTKIPAVVTSVTFAPVEDSLKSLVASEGGDAIPDEELLGRFVSPYLNLDEEQTVLVKQGITIILQDANGKTLEFIINHVDAKEESGDSEGKTEIFLHDRL